MKKIIQLVSFLALAFVFGGVSANAQAPTTKVDADIPFDFVVGDKAFPAGKYVLRITPNSSGAQLLEVRNENREIVYRGLIAKNGDQNTSRSELKFDRIAGRAVLSGIVTAEDGYSVVSSDSARFVAGKRTSESTKN